MCSQLDNVYHGGIAYRLPIIMRYERTKIVDFDCVSFECCFSFVSRVFLGLLQFLLSLFLCQLFLYFLVLLRQDVPHALSFTFLYQIRDLFQITLKTGDLETQSHIWY